MISSSSTGRNVADPNTLPRDGSPSGRTGTGIFGGTFNPIHLGHLRAAEEVTERLGLARMLFVPSARPPHKAAGQQAIAPAADRLAWVKAAVAGNPRFDVDPIEVDRDGPSYLVDTLRSFRERLTPDYPVFTLGRDAFEEMDAWREPKALFTLANFAVTTRPPLRPGYLREWFPEGLGAAFEIADDGLSGKHRDAGTWIRLIEITALDISASSIRQQIRDGGSVRYLLPEAIHDSVVAGYR
jgi:nicotinate-nucleotide adenylyltransferase